MVPFPKPQQSEWEEVKRKIKFFFLNEKVPLKVWLLVVNKPNLLSKIILQSDPRWWSPFPALSALPLNPDHQQSFQIRLRQTLPGWKSKCVLVLRHSHGGSMNLHPPPWSNASLHLRERQKLTRLVIRVSRWNIARRNWIHIILSPPGTHKS